MRGAAGCDFERTVVVRGAEQARFTSALRAGVLRRAVSPRGTAQKRGALAAAQRYAGSAAGRRGVRTSLSWVCARCGVRRVASPGALAGSLSVCAGWAVKGRAPTHERSFSLPCARPYALRAAWGLTRPSSGQPQAALESAAHVDR